MKYINAISPSVIKRMPKYLRVLRDLERDGRDRISSAQIAMLLGTTASQVRQDLSAFGSYGSQGYGYNITYLAGEIEKILGLNHEHTVAIVGVGGIGKALLEHMEFERYNYRVSAAFDIDPHVIGTMINGVQVYSMLDFYEVTCRHPVDICMLAVPKEVARDVAKQLYHMDVPAIWNFTNVDLKLDSAEIVVQNVNFLDSLFTLTYYLEESGLLMEAKKAANL